MFQMLQPLLVFETQRQTANRRPQVIRCVAAALAVLALAISQYQANVLGGMSLVGSGLPMLRGLAAANYAMTVIVALGLFAPTMAQERESGTLPLLVIANIRFRPFVFGKWMQYLIPVGLVVFVELPLLFSAVFFGGVTHVQTVSTVTLLVAFLLFTSSLGLCVSVIVRGAKTSVLVTAAVIAAFEFGPWVARQLVAQQSGGLLDLGPTLWQLLRAVSETHSVSTFETTLTVLNSTSSPVIAATLGWQMTATVVCLGCAIGLAPSLARIAGTTDAGGRLSEEESGGRRQRATRSIRRESHRVQGDAMAWKEFRFHIYSWRGLGIRAAIYLMATVLSIALLSYYKVRPSDAWSVLFTVLALLALIDLVSMSARLFGGELRDRTLGALVLTTSRPGEIYWRKLLGLSPALALAGIVFVVAESLRPNAVSFWFEDSWPGMVFVGVSVLLWLQLIVLMSLDFPLLSVFVGTVGVLVCWVAGYVFAMVWLSSVGRSITPDVILLAASYFLGLVTIAAHAVCLFRIGTAAGR